MRKRAQSAILQTTDLDFCVLTYTCTDPTIHKALGVNTKVSEWKVQCRNAPPLDIVVVVDKNVLGRTEVGIKCTKLDEKGRGNTEKIFPFGSAAAQSRMVEDFTHVWPFRGMARGINEHHFVEVRLFHVGQDSWFPGTVLKQRPDGFFEVLVSRPNASGYYSDELYPFVNKNDLREAATRAPYTAPERQLHLKVMASDPLKGTELTVDGGEDITRYFGRPTPNARNQRQPPTLNVTRDRSTVTGAIGHRELMAYWDGTAEAVTLDSRRAGVLVGYGSKKWTMMVGLCQHTIEIERKHKTSKHITLKVDGSEDKDILIEAIAEDIGSFDGWQCGFRFVGEPILNFNVFETDNYGNATNVQDNVPLIKRYNRLCFIDIQDYNDLSKANFFVDGVSYTELPLYRPQPETQSLTISPLAMSSQYQITVPYKVNKQETGGFGMGNIAGGLFNFGGMGQSQAPIPGQAPYGGLPGQEGYHNQHNEQGGLSGLLSLCCGPPAVNNQYSNTQEWQQDHSGAGNVVYMQPTLDQGYQAQSQGYAGGQAQGQGQGYGGGQSSGYNNQGRY